MSITATVEDGKIILPSHLDWPTGAVVRVELLPSSIPFDGVGLPPSNDELSCYALCKDLFDNLEPDGPDDLSSNPKHLEDMGA